MKKFTGGVWSVEYYQHRLEHHVKKGYFPLPRIHTLNAKYTFEAYKNVDNKSAKHACLIQLAYILAGLRLQNPGKRLGLILKDTGITVSFAKELLSAYTNKKECKL